MYKNYSFLLPVLMLLAASCGSGSSGDSHVDSTPLELKYASLLSIDRGDGWDRVTITNPWDTS